MNYEGQLFSQHHHSRMVRERHVNPAATQFDSLRHTETMQKVQAHDDETLGSGSSGADNNALDNGTDTFGREIMQYERDARRLRNATRGDPQPLLKTRARPRISDLVARREREEETASGQHHIRAGSSGSNDSNPPLNVPRDWGTRAKSHRGWMRKIREPSEVDIRVREDVAGGGLLTPEEDVPAPRRTSYASDNVLSQEEDHAIAMQNTPPSMRRARLNSQPTTVREANSTLRHILDSEDQDFGDLSLLASTPAATRSTQRPHDLTNNDGRGVERHYATGRHQDLLTERSPNRNTRHAQSRETTLDYSDTRTVPKRDEVPRPATASLAEARIARRRGLTGNKENVPVDDTNGTYARPSETVTITDRTARAVTFKQHQRPAHSRNGSLHLLQRLATSLSPSPGKSSSENVQPNLDKAAPPEQYRASRQNRFGDGTVNSDQPLARRSQRTSSSAQEEDGERRALSSHRAAAKEAPDRQSKTNETPVPTDRSLDDKTPVVTGAWIDTPGPSKNVRPALPSTKSAPARASATSSEGIIARSKDTQAVVLTKPARPNRPRSALEEIVRDARQDPNNPFGDATIQSLEDIVHPDVDPTDTTLTFDAGASRNDVEVAENLVIGRPLTQAEKDRRQEDLAIESMNKHLRAARTSIKDADRGLQRVENKWESTSHTEVLQHTATKSTPKEVAKLDQDWKTVCEHCGGCYRSVWWGLWTKLRSNFYYYDDTAGWGIRLTWLGILTFLWVLWNILENFLCYHYCHPLYAEFMEGFGVDPDAPRYPFVIPTLLFRPLRPVWKPALQWVEASFTAIYHSVFGGPPERDLEAEYKHWRAAHPHYPPVPGYEHLDSITSYSSTWAHKAAETTAAVVGRVTGSLMEAVDDMGYGFMHEDEYL